MKIILARHGNTFSPGQKVFCVGANNDLPLVEEGRRQAERLAHVLRQINKIDVAYCAPLQRTKQFAEIAIDGLQPAPQLVVDKRLIELDFGGWSGLTDEDIQAKFGAQCLLDWNEKCIWPKNCAWASSPEEIEDEVSDWLTEMQSIHPTGSTIFAVSSNGRLRYFLKLVPNEFVRRVAMQNFKVATGNVCLLQLNGETVSLKLWNAAPESLLQC